MVSVANLSMQFGGRYLFNDVSFRLAPHERIGLVGSNGSGKSTLLRILLGEVHPERGEVAKAKFVTVGYLPQEGMHVEGKTLYEEVASAYADILEVQSRLEEIHQRMNELDHESNEFQELLQVYGELQHRLEESDAFRMKFNIEKVLMGLGFSERDFGRQTDEFSGGWQMRIALARLLLTQPSLLLLDEPTNHLDLDSLQWLEEYLKSYDGAVIVVSHDRRFLDTLTNRTIELSLGKLTEYAGNYSLYLQEKETRKTLLLAAHKNQQQHIKQTERFIERFRYKATKARQVQSRLKQLEKLERVEIEEDESEIHFDFPPAPPSGRVVMELQAIRKSYGGIPLFQGLDLDVYRGDKMAFVGVNGAGKSTLARIIAGLEPVDGGERNVGHNVVISYFAQHQAEELDPSLDVLTTVDAVAVGEIRKRLRSILGCFLFSGDDVFKRVSVLSGGEKSRLALAKMMLQPANLIVMDEPTNHLDMRSKNVVQQALLDFEGTCIIVSHDRDFLDPIVDKVVEFKSGRARTYPGSVRDYIYAKQKEQSAGGQIRHAEVRSLSGKERKRLEAEERQTRYKQIRPIEQKLKDIEASIHFREARKNEIEQQMAEPAFYQDGARVKEVSAQYKTLEKELESEYFKWNELSKELDALKGASGETGR